MGGLHNRKSLTRSRKKARSRRPPAWKRFENTIAELQKHLAPGAQVTANDKVLGRSERRRQCDVTIRGQVGPYPTFILIECRKKKRRVQLGAVEEFAKKMEDVGANVGVMIAPSGFSAGAKAIARQEGITLTNYRTAEKTDWLDLLRRMSTPGIIVKSIYLVRCDITLAENGPAAIGTVEDFKLYDSAGEVLSIDHFIQSLCKDSQLDAQPIGPITATRAGTGLFANNPHSGKRVAVRELKFRIVLTAHSYDLPIELQEGHVLEPADQGGVVVRSFTTSGVDLRELLEKGTGRLLSREDYKNLTEKSDFFWSFDSDEGPKRYIRLVLIDTQAKAEE